VSEPAGGSDESLGDSLPARFTPLPAGVAGTLCPPVASGTFGECVVAGDGSDGILIVRADPCIAVSGMLLRDWHEGTPGYISLECRGNPGHEGDLIRIEGASRRVVYVITRAADPVNDVWEACWPD
jgi:hypothetical protein